ncbi:MAG: NAD(+)/NADH kinase [Clostridia bacterium]|nr:NAD(+)/NADH kinase [Clostridia bacterium]
MKLYVLSNPLRDQNFEAAQKTAMLCASFGAEVILPPDVPIPENAVGITNARTSVISEIHPDVVVTLGGDGTLLRASHEAAPLGIPMIGVNFGTVGFLTELDRNSLDHLKKLVTGDYSIEERMMLHCTLYRDGEPIYATYALNDCIIARGETLRNISLTLYSDDTEIKSFSGDGLVVSTPTGSTAYSLSAGGPIVDPCASVFVVTPVCAHALYAKSFVLSSFRTVRVVSDQSDGKAVRMSCDGVDSIPMYNGDIVTIERSSITTKLIKLTDNDFFERLGTKLSER